MNAVIGQHRNYALELIWYMYASQCCIQKSCQGGAKHLTIFAEKA